MATSPFLRGGNLRDSLGTTMNGILARVPPAERRAIRDAVAAEGLARGIVYEDDSGRPQPTPILLRPRILGGNQRAYLHKVSRVLESAHQRLFHLWHELSAVRALLPLTDREERWLFDLCRPGVTDDVFFGRFDASSDFASRDWVRSTQFFEYNPIGAGGTYLGPATDAVILKNLIPTLRRHAPTLLLEPNDDPRTVLLEVLADYARSLRLKRFHVALCQYKDLPGGVNEFPQNVEYLRAMGVQCWHVDPLELRRDGDELMYEDHPIDLVYRDHEVNDFAAKEEAGHDLSGMRFALHSGRCVSSLAGEFDHKSAFQVFTSPQFASYFTGEQRRVFARHVPWTRMVADERSTDPEGREVDLLWWLQRNKDECVLKPNRSYGGEGILLGRESEQADWDAALQKALTTPRGWVVQGYRPVAELDFPVIGDDGEMQEAEYFSVLGLFPSFQRLAILGRASRRKVVNVAQKGGIVAVLRLL